jgi:hypothetical protein
MFLAAIDRSEFIDPDLGILLFRIVGVSRKIQFQKQSIGIEFVFHDSFFMVDIPDFQGSLLSAWNIHPIPKYTATDIGPVFQRHNYGAGNFRYRHNSFDHRKLCLVQISIQRKEYQCLSDGCFCDSCCSVALVETHISCSWIDSSWSHLDHIIQHVLQSVF